MTEYFPVSDVFTLISVLFKLKIKIGVEIKRNNICTKILIIDVSKEGK